MLMRAIQTRPEACGENYIAYAQLSEGEDALNMFEKALQVVQNDPDCDADNKIRQQCHIYCSLAELFMTDLCMCEDAETRCEAAVQAALALKPDEHEALQTQASMRISQNRPEEAAESLARSIESWASLPLDDPDYPTFEFRLTCSRLLVELGSFDVALPILESLSQEDDEISEVWYLLALSLYSLEMKPLANEALLQAERLLAMNGEHLEEMLDAVAELREALGPAEALNEPDCGMEQADVDDEDEDATGDETEHDSDITDDGAEEGDRGQHHEGLPMQP